MEGLFPLLLTSERRNLHWRDTPGLPPSWLESSGEGTGQRGLAGQPSLRKVLGISVTLYVRWYHRCLHMSKIIKLYTLHMCSSS